MNVFTTTRNRSNDNDNDYAFKAATAPHNSSDKDRRMQDMDDKDVDDMVFWGRDEDGTGSIHPCSYSDRDAVAFIRSDIVESVVVAAWAEIDAFCVLEDSLQIRVLEELEKALIEYREDTARDNFETAR